MNNTQKAAAAILAARKGSKPVYCWVEAGDNAKALKAEYQLRHPLREIITISWG